MRIGIFTDTYPPYINGVSTSVAMLENGLKKLGHDVFIVTVNSEKMAYNVEDDHIIRIPGIPIGIYDYRLTGIYPLKALAKIQKWNLDVIHSHTEFGVGTFARIIAKQYDIPLVHTYHTMYEDYVHYITKGYFNGASKKIVEYLTEFYCDKTASELIVPTKKTYDLFKKKYKYERNVHIIPTGIEIERFYGENFKNNEIDNLRTELGIKKDDFVVLFVGRLGREKSVDVLIEGHAALAKKYKNLKLIIVGDGPDGDEFKALAKKSKVSDSVIFTGKVPWERVPLYYQLATVFATASTTETQGLTVIEAMAASKPVLAIDDESFRIIVVDDLNGKTFNNRRNYKKVLEELINDPSKVKYMSSQARNSAEPYSSKYFAERVLDVYKKAIEPNKKKQNTYMFKLKDLYRRIFYGKKKNNRS